VGPLLSIWLLPGADLHSELAARVRRIAEALGSPPFTPHVTVLGDFRAEPEAARRTLAQVAATTAPLALTPRGIATSTRRFQALTVRFEPSGAFDALSAALLAPLGVATSPLAPPHLSLAYPLEPYDAAGLPELVDDVPLQSPYLFEQLALVYPGPGRKDWHDVTAWRVLDTRPLGAPAP
jgi:hypothetical protein